MSFSEPTTLPEWASDPAALIEVPTTGKQEQGWTTSTNTPAGVGEKPPLQYFNWYQNLVYQWIGYLSEGFAALGTMATQDADAVAITGGTMADVVVTGGSIDGSEIGATTPGDGFFTNINAILPKCMGSIFENAGTYTLNASSLNIASISKLGTGQVQITFDTAFASSEYIVSVSSNGGTSCTYANVTTTTVDVSLYNDSILEDTSFSITIFYNA